MQLKVGDWVIQDYAIKQIRKIEENGSTEVSDGAFSTSGYSILKSCRPLNLRNKRYAESIQYQYDELKKVKGSNALNWPDINRYFSDLCLKAIDDTKTDYKEGETNQYLKEAREFTNKTIDRLSGIGDVNGVRIFR